MDWRKITAAFLSLIFGIGAHPFASFSTSTDSRDRSSQFHTWETWSGRSNRIRPTAHPGSCMRAPSLPLLFLLWLTTPFLYTDGYSIYYGKNSPKNSPNNADQLSNILKIVRHFHHRCVSSFRMLPVGKR